MNFGKVEKEILKLDKTKASQKTDISTRIIDIFADFLCTSINSAIKSSGFPSSLKLVDVTPMHKKGRKDMKNFFEKCMFDNIFLNQQCSFRKRYSTQHCLLVMLETWKRSVDKGKVFGALLTDLSKALDCLDHELLTAKLNAYGFSLPAENKN